MEERGEGHFCKARPYLSFKNPFKYHFCQEVFSRPPCSELGLFLSYHSFHCTRRIACLLICVPLSSFKEEILPFMSLSSLLNEKSDTWRDYGTSSSSLAFYAFSCMTSPFTVLCRIVLLTQIYLPVPCQVSPSLGCLFNNEAYIEGDRYSFCKYHVFTCYYQVPSDV